MQPEEFAIEERRGAGCRTLALRGEIDVATAPTLEARVMEVCRDDAEEILLDMSRVSFIDSSGLNALLRLKEVCEEHGCELYLTPGRPPVERLFDITRLRNRLPFRREPRQPSAERDAS